MTDNDDRLGLDALCRRANAQADGWGSPRRVELASSVRRPVLLMLGCGLGLLALAGVAAYVGSEPVHAVTTAVEPARGVRPDAAAWAPAVSASSAPAGLAPSSLPSMRAVADDEAPAPPAAPASSSVSPEEAISQPDGSC